MLTNFNDKSYIIFTYTYYIRNNNENVNNKMAKINLILIRWVFYNSALLRIPLGRLSIFLSTIRFQTNLYYFSKSICVSKGQ